MSANESTLTTARGITTRVLTVGVGAPLLFLHGAWGLDGNREFIEELGQRYQVIAPEWPGFGESGGELLLDDMLDFALHGWDVVAAAGLQRPTLVGHSLGGMIAAEMAALNPEGISALTLVTPLGLWVDDHPIPDLFAILPTDLPKLLFADENCASAKANFSIDFADHAAMTTFLVDTHRRLGTAAKVLFPIPDRRLSKRAYRISTPTSVVWGAHDNLLDKAAYGDAWRAALPAATVSEIAGAGHMVPFEQPAELAASVSSHIAAAGGVQ